MKSLATILSLALCCTAARAQKLPVIADMETRLPIQGATIATDNAQRAVTDYAGRFHTPLAFGSATVSKKHYMQRRVGAAELRQDTVFMIPQEVVLDDVVVTAPGFSFDTRKALQRERENAALPNPAQGFNLLGLFQLLVPSKKAKAQDRAQKIKKILDNY